jgi:hypothetical protein
VGEVPLNDVAAGSVTPLHTVRITFSDVKVATADRLEIEIRLKSGHRLAENSYDLFVLPRSQSAQRPPISLAPGVSERLASKLQSAGHAISASDGRESVLVASRFDDAVAHLQNGGRVLLLADSEDAMPADSRLKVKLRAGTELDGRWFSNFNWIRTDQPPFSEVAFTPILGFESARVAPHYVVQGMKADEFTDVLCGITFGWLNKNSALALQTRVGTGKLLLTTFRFDDYGADAYATSLLDALIRYVSGPECQPKLELAIPETVLLPK